MDNLLKLNSYQRGRIIIIVFTLLCTAYIGWETYWYFVVGLAFVKWHTHLAFYILPIGYVLFFLFYSQNLRLKNALLAFASGLLTLLGIETVCLIFNINKTYLETVGSHYVSAYNATGASYYHVHPHNTSVTVHKPEYTFYRETNSLGFADKEWPIQKRKKRILCLGDSFTEGDGTSADSSYVSVLEKLVNCDSAEFELMNAGTLGSDPFFNYINLKDRLTKYNPDIIIQTISSGDITADLATRGGMERFQNNQMLRFKTGPWWEPIYAISYSSRFLFNTIGYNTFLIRNEDAKKNKIAHDNAIIELLDLYEKTLIEHNTIAYIVFRPDKGEVLGPTGYDFSVIIQNIQKRKNIQVVNLVTDYNVFFAKDSVKLNDYFWRKDGHHNGKGYALMSSFIYRQIFNKSK